MSRALARQTSLPHAVRPMLMPNDTAAPAPRHAQNPADIHQGLTTAEARRRLQQYGPNELTKGGHEPIWRLVWRQFRSLTVLVLLAAAAFSWVMGDTTESLAIAAVVLINGFIGFWLEWQARVSMEALHQLDVPKARVMRDGHAQTIPAPALTVGDILLIEAGDVLPADAELLEGHQLQVNESALTGESVPVTKQPGVAASTSLVTEQPNSRLFKGTAAVNGHGRAVVNGVGMATELGRIAELVQSTGHTTTPLETKINHLARQLILLTLGLALLYLAIGLVQGRDALLMLKMAIILAIAAIPEGLAIVATLALAHGMLHLARHQVIVKRLAAVETLGSTSVIFTDKTGTLTHNQIAVNTLWLAPGRTEVALSAELALSVTGGNADVLTSSQYTELLRVATACNNAPYTPGTLPDPTLGDPVEVALNQLAFAAQAQTPAPRVAEQPFSPDTRLMATVHERADGTFLVAVKGAAEEVLRHCQAQCEAAGTVPLSATASAEWQERAELLARSGLRTLGFASAVLLHPPGPNYVQNLTWIGLIGFLDPPRLEVKPALQACHQAGIRVIMVTGDHPATAVAVATKVGLAPPNNANELQVIIGEDLKPNSTLTPAEKQRLYACSVFARVSPAQKLDLIALYQQRGDIVGMTGDGVNDAPALRKADIGIAMGKRGTQVAAEAADMVLQDDAFASIVTAIGQGRVIFANIRTFILYLTSCNLSEILLVTIVGLLHKTVPLLPLQILFLNMITDVFPALALALGAGAPRLMQQPPRAPQLPLLSRADWQTGLWYAAALTVSALAVYLYAWEVLQLSTALCNNVLFFGMAIGQLLHVFNFSADHRISLRSEVSRNRYVWLALGLCLSLFAVAYFVPAIREVLAIQPLTLLVTALALTAGILPVVLVQGAYRLAELFRPTSPASTLQY